MTEPQWTHIILHHSLTEDGPTVSWQAIRRYHVETLGWKDIGYHFGVEWVNREYEIFVGRPLDQAGAHTIGMNDKAIGVCCVGNYDVQYPTEALISKLVPLVRVLCRIFSIPKDHIAGHRDYAPKSCPGKNFDLDMIRSRL